MNAKAITEPEMKERERLQANLEAAADALVEPQQRYEREKFRVDAHNTKLARKYRLMGEDRIEVDGSIVRKQAP